MHCKNSTFYQKKPHRKTLERRQQIRAKHQIALKLRTLHRRTSLLRSEVTVRAGWET